MTTTSIEPREILDYELSGQSPDSSGQHTSVSLSGCPPLYRADSRDTPDRSTPIWLAEHIDSNRRTAKPATCPRCDTTVLVGPDHDHVAATATVDPEPVTLLEEAVALLTGRHSYDLAQRALHHRGIDRVMARRNNDPIHLSHQCEKAVLF